MIARHEVRTVLSVCAASLIGVAMAASIGTRSDAARAATLLPLTFTDAQVQDGRNKVLSTCALCHKADLSGGVGPALKGTVFTQKWFPGSVATLFTFIKTNMPKNAPGTLSDTEVSALIALISSRNGKIAGSVALPNDPLALTGMGFDQPQSPTPVLVNGAK